MSFADDIKKIVLATKDKQNSVVRKIVFDISTSLVFKSPVGNPSLWEGWKEGGVKENSEHWLVKADFVHEGYVGGRFRGNWQYGLNQPDKTTTETIDADGNNTTVAILGEIPKEAGGHIHYITNSLPYAKRLEEGYSRKQAPQGMVGITVLEWEKIVREAAESFK